jgi:hypothetical protein
MECKVAAPPFELACLQSTLRTLRLAPGDVLRDDSRLPNNRNDPLLEIARPTWIGKNYRIGGVLLLGKNPAGGSVAHRQVPHPSDRDFAPALAQLAGSGGISSYRAWRDLAQPSAMSSWRIWTVSVGSVLGALRPLGIGNDDIAFGNLVPFRTEGNAVKSDEFVRAWDRDVRHVVTLLRPRLIVKMTAEFPAFSRLVSDSKVLDFRRSNGDRYVTSAGAEDIRIIQEWAEKNLLA